MQKTIKIKINGGNKYCRRCSHSKMVGLNYIVPKYRCNIFDVELHASDEEVNRPIRCVACLDAEKNTSCNMSYPFLKKFNAALEGGYCK